MSKAKHIPVAMKAGKFYYRVPVESETGKGLTNYMQAQQSVDKAAAKEAERCGAETYIVRTDAIGGLQCVTFPEDYVPDPKVWALMYDPKEMEGEVKYFIPNVQGTGRFATTEEAEQIQKDCEAGKDCEEGMAKLCGISNETFRGTSDNILRLHLKFEDMVRWTGIEVKEEAFPVLQHRRKMYLDKEKAKVGKFEFENPTDEQLSKSRAEYIQLLVAMTKVELHHVQVMTGTKEAISIFARWGALPVMDVRALPHILQAAPQARRIPTASPQFFKSKDEEYYYFAYGLPCNCPDREKVTRRAFEYELNQLSLNSQL